MPQLATFGSKVPVTVVTGFLGSGKTTLLNYFLSTKGDRNICVVENEFGEINIDKTLGAVSVDDMFCSAALNDSWCSCA